MRNGRRTFMPTALNSKWPNEKQLIHDVMGDK